MGRSIKPAGFHLLIILYSFASFIPILVTSSPSRTAGIGLTNPPGGLLWKGKMMDRNDMPPPKPRVRFYAGFKGDETPRTVILSGHEYPVERILWRKRIRPAGGSDEFEVFRCQLSDRQVEIRRSHSGETGIRIIEDQQTPQPRGKRPTSSTNKKIL